MLKATGVDRINKRRPAIVKVRRPNADSMKTPMRAFRFVPDQSVTGIRRPTTAISKCPVLKKN